MTKPKTTAPSPEALSIGDAIARVEAVLASLNSVTPATVNPDGTPGPVSPGELIESAWGNAVSNTAESHRDQLAILTRESALIQIAPASPWTGNTSYIRHGNWVFVQINIGRASAWDQTDLGLGTLPNGFRPYPGSAYGMVHVADAPGATDVAAASYSRSVLFDASTGSITILQMDIGNAAGGTARGCVVFPTNPGMGVP